MRFRAHQKENIIPIEEGQKILRVLDRAVTGLNQSVFPNFPPPSIRLSSHMKSRFLASYNGSSNTITFWWSYVKGLFTDKVKLLDVRDTILHELAHHGVFRMFSVCHGGEGYKQGHGKEFRAVVELIALKFNIHPIDISMKRNIPKHWLDESRWTKARSVDKEFIDMKMTARKERKKMVAKDVDFDFLRLKLDNAINAGIKIGFTVHPWYIDALSKFDKVLYAYDPKQFERDKKERYRINGLLTDIRLNPTDERGNSLRVARWRANSSYTTIADKYRNRNYFIILIGIPKSFQKENDDFLESKGINTDVKPIESIF